MEAFGALLGIVAGGAALIYGVKVDSGGRLLIRALWTVFGCVLIALGLVGVGALLLGQTDFIKHHPIQTTAVVLVLAILLSLAVLHSTGMIPFSTITTAIARIRLRSPIFLQREKPAGTHATLTVSPPAPAAQRIQELEAQVAALTRPDSTIAGTLSLERVGLVASVDPASPEFASIQPAITWINASPIVLSYHVRSIVVTDPLRGMDAYLDPPGSASSLRPNKSEMYLGPTLGWVDVGRPLSIRVKFVVDYGRVGTMPSFRSSRAIIIRGTVRGHNDVNYHGPYIVEESTEEPLDARGELSLT